MKYSALLFDLDGTLVDTITLYLDAFMEAIVAIGHTPSRKEWEDWYQKGWHISDIAEHVGIPEESIPALREDRDLRYERLLRTKVEWMPGAVDLLNYVTKNHKTAVVTGSWMKYVDALNVRTPIKSHISTIITANDMGHYMKPHPHGLLLAADALNVAPEECLYVGDQLFDLEAAQAAGMRSCLYVSRHTPHEAHKQADFVLHSLDKLSGILS